MTRAEFVTLSPVLVRDWCGLPYSAVVSVDFDVLTPRIAELCRRYGVRELAVFGSVARGEDRPDSDVDLLYVREPDNMLGLAFLDLQDELAKLLGRDVDLVPRDHLHWVIRDRVLADARVLYAA